MTLDKAFADVFGVRLAEKTLSCAAASAISAEPGLNAGKCEIRSI